MVLERIRASRRARGRRRAPRRAASLLVLLTFLVTSSGTHLAAASAAHPRLGASTPVAGDPDPTLRQLEADIAASVTITTSPNLSTTIPPILSLTTADGSLVPQRTACYSGANTTTVPVNALTYCAYGDLAARSFILLTGDSQAGMWLPALNQVALQLDLKVVFLAKSGCAPWGNPNPPDFIIWKDITVADCTAFDKSVADWAIAHRPVAVVLDGRGYPLGSNIDAPPVLATLESEMANEAARLAPSAARIIVISPLPRYDPSVTPWFPNTCLGYAHPITQCEFSPAFLLPHAEFRAERAESKLGVFTVANVTPLFCTATRCALFVHDAGGNHLIYDTDGAHTNRFYSAWISSAFRRIIEPLLPS